MLIGEPAVAVVGFALVGVGIANAVPLLFSAAGRVPPSGPSLAAVFTVGYTGFIVGPPLIGVLADAISLPAALGVLCVSGLAVTLLGSRAADAEAAGRRAAASRPPHERSPPSCPTSTACSSTAAPRSSASGASGPSRAGLDPDEVGRTSHGVPGVQVIERFAPELDAAAESERLDEEHAQTGGVALPGAAELLASIAPLAVVTSCTPPLATRGSPPLG